MATGRGPGGGTEERGALLATYLVSFWQRIHQWDAEVFEKLLEKYGLMARAGNGALLLTNRGLGTAIFLGLILIRSFGLVQLLTWPFVLLAFVARVVLGIYQYANIILDLAAAGSILLFLVCENQIRSLLWSRKSALRLRLAASQTYADYQSICQAVDEEEGNLGWRDEERDLPQVVILRRTLDELEDAIHKDNMPHLRFILGGLFRRNHLGIDSPCLHQRCLSGTKHIIERYQKKLIECLHIIAETKHMSTEEKQDFFRQARRSLGRTALCLSGGGSMAMYHLGAVRALIEEGVFRYIKVFSGASGGSILAALIAMKTEKELLTEVLVDTFSQDFTRDGRQAAERIQWFFRVKPFPIMQCLCGWGLLDRDELVRTVSFYLQDVTFAEAYQRTGRHVTISVSASSLAGYAGADELLLNHLTTPNVLLRSAVVASSSLPGVLPPSTLLHKDLHGQILPFYLNGVEWIDGSWQADIPVRGLTSMFSVSNFIVSQVNPHVVPFLSDDEANRPKHWYRTLFKMLAMDISYRASSLQQLKLLPTFFGQDIMSVFRQTYSGQVTIIPPFRLLDSTATKAAIPPNQAEMKYYLSAGARACWRHLYHISHLMEVEIQLTRLSARVASNPQDRHHPLSLRSLDQHNSPLLLSMGSGSLTGGLAKTFSIKGVGSSMSGNDEAATVSSCLLRQGSDPRAEEEDDEDEDVQADVFLVNKEYELKGQTEPSLASGDYGSVLSTSGSGAGWSPALAGTGGSKGGQAGGTRRGTGRSGGVVDNKTKAAQVLQGLRGRMKWLEEENRKLQEQLGEFMGSVDYLLHYESKLRGDSAGGQGEDSDGVLDLDRSLPSPRAAGSGEGLSSSQQVLVRRHSD